MQIPILRETLTSWATSITEKTVTTTGTEPSTTAATTAMGPLARLTILLAALCPSLVLSDTPDSIPQIRSIKFSGSGCPSDPKYTGGLNDLRISYGEFAIQTPGDHKTENCEVQIQAFGGSPGWQVSLRDLWVSGHRWQQPGTSLDIYATTYFSQDATRTNTKKDSYPNNGGDTIDEDVTFHSDLSGNEVWSPCFGGDGYTGIFAVNFRGALSGGDGRASFVAWSQNWGLDWRRC